ncbi:Zn-ribbon domain-containing OB-fold protein [Desertibacillus haloalkaliphilus]|uniref:Zn-ribbon domain-containing OB-fold protein n=1 Tax=Desertibacillus haloalkaliphilus TaxID=1328930 RepID=UPI001C27C5EC|nr:Zn-ribbon domain-containing OB-fold protein [Desertibacillus haloalkaliphilus]MBU8906237.1 Zn-ribbon domain-containing OB-fold protein [Desertibacillus haloalkaliphilus]
MSNDRTLPKPTLETKRYWEGCKNHELLIQQCSDCGAYQFYPRMLCTDCMSRNVEWVNASGTGKISSFTIVRRAPNKAYAADVPYVLALIKLDEGPTMMSNVIECEPEKVKIGMKVEVVFDDWTEEISIPKFRLL